MPDEQGRLYAADIAADLGIDASTWRSYVSRGQAPDPDDRVVDGRHLRPVWKPETIAAYKRHRAPATQQNGVTP